MAKMNTILECKLNKRCDSKGAKLKLRKLTKGKGKELNKQNRTTDKRKKGTQNMHERKQGKVEKEFAKFQTRLRFPLFN